MRTFKSHEIQRPKICERFGSAARLKAGSHPISGRDSVVTTGDGTVEVCLGTSCKRSPLWLRSTDTMSAWALRAAPAPVTAVASPVRARQPTTPITAIFLAARRLTRSETKSVLFVSISDTPLDGETRASCLITRPPSLCSLAFCLEQKSSHCAHYSVATGTNGNLERLPALRGALP
jgi:hypothetical protein